MNPMDPDELRRLAAGLDRQAGEVRDKASELVAGAASMAWRGSAANALRDEVHHKAAGMNFSAGELERCAGLLRAHASVVEVEGKALELAGKGINKIAGFMKDVIV